MVVSLRTFINVFSFFLGMERLSWMDSQISVFFIFFFFNKKLFLFIFFFDRNGFLEPSDSRIIVSRVVGWRWGSCLMSSLFFCSIVCKNCFLDFWNLMEMTGRLILNG